jgi:hypothetical protein
VRIFKLAENVIGKREKKTNQPKLQKPIDFFKFNNGKELNHEEHEKHEGRKRLFPFVLFVSFVVPML